MSYLHGTLIGGAILYIRLCKTGVAPRLGGDGRLGGHNKTIILILFFDKNNISSRTVIIYLTTHMSVYVTIDHSFFIYCYFVINKKLVLEKYCPIERRHGP